MKNIDEMTVEETFENLPDYFLSEKAEGLEGTVQYVIVGKDGGEWAVEIKNGECKVIRGKVDNPTTTITTRSEVWLEIYKGELGGMEAFSQGKMSVNGNAAFALSLEDAFERADRDL